LAAVNAAKTGTGIELALYQKTGIGEGKQASNPWLQELPDPVTKATWDNYVIMSWGMAKEMLGIDLSNSGASDKYDVNPPKPVVTVTFNNKSLSLPVLIIPGCHPQTIAIALGYGRSGKIGKAAENVG